MKLPELKERLKNKYVVRIVAGVLVIALAGTGVGATYSVQAAKNTQTSESTDSKDSDIDVNDILDKVSVSSDSVDKEESVYVMTDASGNPQETIVTNHLSNKDKADTITDETNLSDIENLKGKETFTQDGSKITWQADGNEIYYQGTTNETTPLKQKVTYMLDGKEISPEDLAGKSGKVTIRFDYENTTEYTKKVNGEDVTVKVPFVALTALMLDDNFTNVEVTNGKVKENGDKNIVIGYAVPGLKESLDINEDDLEDVEIPEYFEMTADVKDFSLSTAMTFGVNATEYLSTSGTMTDDLDDMINDLTDATDQLIDGSGDLSDGADKLADGANTLYDGANTLADGTATLKTGADSLATGAGSVKSGLSTLQTNLKPFSKGMNSLKSGLDAYLDGTKQLNDGIKTLYDGTGSLVAGATTLNSSAKSISDAIATLDATLNAQMTEQERAAIAAQAEAAAEQAVSTSYANGTQAQVAETIYKGLRYKTDGSDGDLYTSLYNGTLAGKYQENLNSTYDKKAVEVLKTAANTYGVDVSQCTTAQQYASAISTKLNYVAQNASALVDAGSLDQATAQQIKVISSVTTGMSASQMAEFFYAKSGANTTLYEAVEAGVSGTLQSDTVKAQVKTGVETALKTIANTLAAGTKDIAANAAKQAASTAAVTSVKSTKATVAAGIEKVQDNGYSLVTGSAALSAGTQSMVDSLPTLTSGVQQLLTGSNKLVKNNKTLKSGISELATGTKSIKGGVDKLAKGSTKLSKGADTLANGAGNLKDGADTLAKGAGDLSDGAGDLSDGAKKLSDGIVEFNDEGISKIVNAYDGDLKPLANRLQAIIDAGNDYQTFSGLAKDSKGSVKFIYKLAAIESSDSEDAE